MALIGAAKPLNADMVTSAMVQDGDSLVAGLGDRASTKNAGDASLMITGVPVPTLNGVLTVRTTATARDVRSLLDIVAGKGLPHSIQIRPGCRSELVDLARQRGLVEDESIPLMAMRMDGGLREFARHPALSIRTLDPDEAGIHTSVAADGFEAPREMFEQLVTPAVLAQAGCSAYVGSVDGQDVVTALAFTGGGHVGIFNVATPRSHRGRGYGTTITAHAVLTGFDSGAGFAYLQSSPAGFRIYERLGFRTLELWSVWVTPGQLSH
jgi:ribosomal protein S18 acetylase RimI-like enzyme